MYSDQFHLVEKNLEINSVSKYNMFGIGTVMIIQMLRLAKVYKVNFCYFESRGGFPLVLVSVLPRAESGPNAHREDAPHYKYIHES